MKNVNSAVNLLLDLASFFGGLPLRPARFAAAEDTGMEEWPLLVMLLLLVATIAAMAAVDGRVAASTTDSATSGLMAQP